MHNYSFGNWLYYKAKNKVNYLKILNELSASQWLGGDLINNYQLQSVRHICDYALTNSPYYADLFKKIGLTNVKEIKSLEDIKIIPALTKQEIRNSLDLITVKQRDDLIPYQTGGSTGVPLLFYANEKFLYEQKWAANIRAYTHGGYRLGDKIGVLWGFDNDIPKRNWKNKIINKLTSNSYEINSFRLTDESMLDFVNKIESNKIQYIKGYASSLNELAGFIVRNNISFRNKIKAVFSEAEKLTDNKRQLIEQAFQSKVFNYYGSREFGTVAVECSEHNGLHINYEQLYVEKDESGNILVTSFLNLGTPFIRYKIGDCADRIVYEKCKCGRSSARINNLVGRESDNFITPGGEVVHGEYVTHLFYHTESICQFQVIQKSPNDLLFNIVSKDENRSREELDGIIQELNKHFGSKLDTEIIFLTQIEKTRTGKQKFTIRSF